MASPLYHRWRLQELHDKIGRAFLEDDAVLESARQRGVTTTLEIQSLEAIERHNSHRADRRKQAKILRGALDPLTAQLYQSIARTALSQAADFAWHRVRHVQLCEVGL